MSFLAPLMLAGGAAVSVPLVLHFFYKARYRPLPWAAMEFLRQSIEQTSRRLKFQEWILLALRCLCLLLLALAFARPTCSSLSAGGESVDAVLVFDTSFSMAAQDGEKTRFERAKDAAIAVVDSLPPNSTVQIITNADRAIAVGPRTPGNLDEARQLIAGLELTSLSGDILPGLDEAFNALDRGAGSVKEVYLFTDLQKSGWDRQSGAVKARAEQIEERAAFVVVRCGNPERPINNVAITDISYFDEIPHTGPGGIRLPVTILLRNTGVGPVRDLTVGLEVDGQTLTKETISVPEITPGQTIPVSLTAKLDEAGPRLLTATVQSDDLPGDNRLDRLVVVRDQIRVLVVDGSPDPRDPKESAAHFVRNALLPVARDEVDNYFIRVTVVPPEEAGPGLLELNDLCVLCNVAASNQDRPGIPGLRDDFVEQLRPFVENGGGLLIGLGDNVVPARYTAVLGPEGIDLLPFEIDQIATATPADPFQPAPETTETPGFLSPFASDPYQTAMADVELSRIGVLAGEAAPSGRVLMRLADGRPWLVARGVGDGEVVFASTSFDTSWGNWAAKGGAFVSFVQFALAHMVDRSAVGVNRSAGQPLVWHPAELDERGYDVVRPDDRRDKIENVQPGDGPAKPTVTVADTDLAGVYGIEVIGESTASPPRFAVAPDLRESDDLTSLTDDEVEQAVGFDPLVVLAGDGAGGELASQRSRREWTIWLFLALFALAAAEATWAWVCGRAW